MSRDSEPIMATLQARAKDTPRSAKERLLAAEKEIKSWLAQTNDLAEQARMLRDLDAKVAGVDVDDFWPGCVLISRNSSTPSPPGTSPSDRGKGTQRLRRGWYLGGILGFWYLRQSRLSH
jgi:hypothetical protein